MCVIFIFFLSSDVSTFKKINIVKIIRCRRTKKIDYWLDVESSNKKIDTIDWLTDSKNKKIDNWLIDKVFILHHDELTDFQNKKINDWLSLSLIHDHFRKFTMRQVKMKFNHRFQRENFFINADSRSFSLIHVVDDFFLTRVFLRMIRRFFFWTFVYFYER